MSSKSWALSTDPATRGQKRESKKRRPGGRLSVHQLFVELDGRASGHETPHDGNDREHEQNVNEATAYVEHHEAEQPQNE